MQSSNGKKFKRRRGKAGAQLSEERTFSLDEYAATLQDQQNTLDSTQDIRTNYSRVLGVDLGKRRTGVAVSAGGLAPRALEVGYTSVVLLEFVVRSPGLSVAFRNAISTAFYGPRSIIQVSNFECVER